MARLAGKGTHYRLALLNDRGEATSHVFEVPSVTHVLDVVYSKPALQYWTYRETLGGLAYLLKKYGASLPSDADSLASLLKREKLRPMDQRDSAAKSGTDAHSYFEEVMTGDGRKRGKLLRMADDPAAKGIAAWYEREGKSLSVVACENPVVSLAGGYAGTLDLVTKDVWGKHCLLDLKTGGVYHTSFIQLAAYKLAWEERGGPEITSLAILQSRRDIPGYTLHTITEPGKIQDLARTWRAALELYQQTPKKYVAETVDTYVPE